MAHNKHKPVRVRGNNLTVHGTPRTAKLPAKQLGPWQMLLCLIRYQAGESSQSIKKDFGVSNQTLARWQRAYGTDTKHIHKAAAVSVVAHELVLAREELRALQREISARLARIERITRDHGMQAIIEDLYPADSLELKRQKAY